MSRALQLCVSNGITHVQTNDADGFWDIYQSLLNEQNLPIRVSLTPSCLEMLQGQRSSLFRMLEIIDSGGDTHVPPARTVLASGMLRCDRVKLFADGSLGACTAALRKPYK